MWRFKTGRRTLGEVWDGSGDLHRVQNEFTGPSRRFRMGRGTLREVWARLGDPREVRNVSGDQPVGPEQDWGLSGQF